MYNLTNITNATTPWGLTLAVNQASGKLLGIMTVVSLWIVLFVVVQNQGFRAALIGSSALAAFIAVMLWVMEMIAWWWALVPVLITCLGVILWLAAD